MVLVIGLLFATLVYSSPTVQALQPQIHQQIDIGYSATLQPENVICITPVICIQSFTSLCNIAEIETPFVYLKPFTYTNAPDYNLIKPLYSFAELNRYNFIFQKFNGRTICPGVYLPNSGFNKILISNISFPLKYKPRLT